MPMEGRKQHGCRQRHAVRLCACVAAAIVGALRNFEPSASAFVPPPPSATTLRPAAAQGARTALEVLRQTSAEAKGSGCPVTALQEASSSGPGALLALTAAGALAEALGPLRPSAALAALVEHHASLGEDLFLLAVLAVSAYCLTEMASMQMRCSHWEARVHTACNALAALLSVFGIASERIWRESPGLWWAVLTPVLYLVSNFTMTRLMKMYRGPQAYKHLFDLGQSFTLSFQGIHCLAWSSVYPELYWLALPFWYWSLKKLVETVTYMTGVLAGEDPEQLREHRARGETWGAFGLELDVMTAGFAFINLAAALADNAYMGTYTLRGPEDFFEVSRSLATTSQAGWGSDHLRLALVKPAVGSLVVSMSVFLGTLVSRRRLATAVGVPISVLLSSVGPWLVFFWHRLVDPGEPWLPELQGNGWGPAPLAQLFGAAGS